MIEILLDSGRKSTQFIFAALELALEDSAEYQLTDLSKACSSVDADTAVGLIAWFSADTTDCLSQMVTSWERGCRRFALFAPGADKARPWDSAFSPLQHAAFDAAFPACVNVSLPSLQDACSAALASPSWAQQRLNEAIESFRLYSKLLRPFGHGREGDISNRFLAPARLLLQANPDCGPAEAQWRDVWAVFSDRVLLLIDGTYGDRGSELRAASDPIVKWFKGGFTCTSANIERLMAVLTDCRVTAGEHTAGGRGGNGGAEACPEPLLAAELSRPLRLLVVDDHAGAWMPVFKLVQERLSRLKVSASLDFSIDGINVRRSDGSHVRLLQVVPEYDVVLLDVFIGERDGRTILQDIRKIYRGIPVLLWTTSRDQEITRHIPLANGLILKKTTSIDEIVAVIAKWGEEGRTRRLVSLPNPLFDDVIRDEAYRELIRDMTEWCLKQMDSFHALDGAFFRYFTDHGGRHYVKLMELLEQALRPFLSGSDLLPEHPDEREATFVTLYLTVVCHELGMFPMSMHGRYEDFGQLDGAYLQDVRTLHSLRGMALLAGDAGRQGLWPDGAGRLLAQKMDNASARGRLQIRKLLAVLVGYHARFLKSLEKDDEFLVWTEAAEKRFRDRVRSVCPTLESYASVFDGCLRDLRLCFASAAERDRIRRLCALFRFVDAIDISASRNPARFLVLSPSRTPENNREHLKRELCSAIGIGGGRVDARVNALRPRAGFVREVIEAGYPLLPATVRARLGPETKVMPDETEIDRPWDSRFQKSRDSLLVSAKRYQCILDAWLLEFWKTVMGRRTSLSFVEHLRETEVITGDAPHLDVTTTGRVLVAGVTALSVAGEVLDEYEAIIETGLQDRLCLGEFKWSDSEWDADSAPSILGEGLAQYIEDTTAS